MFPSLKHFGIESILRSPLGRGPFTRPLAGASKVLLRETTDIWTDLPVGYDILGHLLTSPIYSRYELWPTRRMVSKQQMVAGL